MTTAYKFTTIRFSDEEMALIDVAAKQERRPRTQFIKNCVLDHVDKLDTKGWDSTDQVLIDEDSK